MWLTNKKVIKLRVKWKILVKRFELLIWYLFYKITNLIDSHRGKMVHVYDLCYYIYFYLIKYLHPQHIFLGEVCCSNYDFSSLSTYLQFFKVQGLGKSIQESYGHFYIHIQVFFLLYPNILQRPSIPSVIISEQKINIEGYNEFIHHFFCVFNLICSIWLGGDTAFM